MQCFCVKNAIYYAKNMEYNKIKNGVEDRYRVMKKLNVAIIGQGRSGSGIHGRYFLTEKNRYYNVKYMVDADAGRRLAAKRTFPDCETFESYRELFGRGDIDLAVNATYSEMHAPVALELIEHGFNVLVEKPFGRTRYECESVIAAAKKCGVVLQVFQQSFYAPYYLMAKRLIDAGTLGDTVEIAIRFNGFSRRWDWQTLQKKCAGGLYNTGPHPVGFALGFLDFDKNARLAYSRLDRGLTSGDGDDFAKLIITAPNKPVVDVEVSSVDAYSDFNIKIQGKRGTFKATPTKYEMTYIVDGENPERAVVESSMRDGNGEPVYCSEELKKHVDAGEFSGTAFDIGTAALYEQLYYKLTEGREMDVTPQMAAEIIGIIEAAHAENPLDVKF